jgi:chromosome segregation ATPase
MGSLSAAAINARKVFLAKIKPGADGSLKKNQDMRDLVLEAIYQTDTLIKAAQMAPIELHVTKLKALTAKVESSIADIDNALAKIKDFARDNKAVIAELDDVSKLTAALADERRKASTRIPVLKQSQRDAEVAIKDLAGSKSELNAQWAVIENDARKAHQEVLGEVKTIYGYRDKANAAAKSKDAKALADAKSKAEMMANPYLSEWPMKMKKKLADFAAQYAKKLPGMNKAVLDQLAQDKAELSSVLDRIALSAKLIDSVKSEIADQK